MRMADTDHNGKVSKAEFIAFNGKVFDAGVLGENIAQEGLQ